MIEKLSPKTEPVPIIFLSTKAELQTLISCTSLRKKLDELGVFACFTSEGHNLAAFAGKANIILFAPSASDEESRMLQLSFSTENLIRWQNKFFVVTHDACRTQGWPVPRNSIFAFSENDCFEEALVKATEKSSEEFSTVAKIVLLHPLYGNEIGLRQRRAATYLGENFSPLFFCLNDPDAFIESQSSLLFIGGNDHPKGNVPLGDRLFKLSMERIGDQKTIGIRTTHAERNFYREVCRILQIPYQGQ